MQEATQLRGQYLPTKSALPNRKPAPAALTPDSRGWKKLLEPLAGCGQVGVPAFARR